jgi:3-oxo-5,6-didehydrosuberyl-CoA/3-oxoadipyl-CoA thiolase
MATREAFIIDTIRTPIGKLAGSLATVRADDMAALVIRELIKRNQGIEPSAIEEVILGCANQAGEDNRNVARMAALLAGLPVSVAGLTVNRLCASGMSAVIEAARAIRLHEGDLFIAGGVEQMTRAPFALAKAEQAFDRKAEIYDTSLGWRFVNPAIEKQYGIDSMGETAENVALQFKINREDQDHFACASQDKAAKARESGRLAQEIVAVMINKPKAEPYRFADDEFIRPDTNMAGLAKLKPVFRQDGKGTVTAGNSSGLNDGACALLLASESAIKRFGLKPRARVGASAVVGVEPRLMGMGPVEASRKVLARAGTTLERIEVIELNEAFAAQSLACLRELGVADNDPRVNPNGGAIALGHPLGMSGARLIGSALIELEQTNKRLALCTMCVGVGLGMAVVVERV